MMGRQASGVGQFGELVIPTARVTAGGAICRLGIGEMKLLVLESLTKLSSVSEKSYGAAQGEFAFIAAETRRLFADSQLPKDVGIVENDRAVLEELFSVNLDN